VVPGERVKEGARFELVAREYENLSRPSREHSRVIKL
jgi:hypothetical protein